MRVVVIGICLLLLVGCQARQQASLSDSDAAKVREAYQAFTSAGTTDEAKHLGRFFAENAVWMPHAGPAVQGRSAIESWFTVRAVNWDHQIVELEGRDDLAYTRASFTLILDLPNFKPCKGDALAIWKRQPSGKWLITNYAQTFDTICDGTQ